MSEDVGVGERRDRGDFDRGGVTGGESFFFPAFILDTVGVAGTKESCGADIDWVNVSVLGVSACMLDEGPGDDDMIASISVSSSVSTSVPTLGLAEPPFRATSNAVFSALRFNIHQSAPAESQALLITLCTICPTSKPVFLSVLRSARSRAVEKRRGAGVERREA